VNVIARIADPAVIEIIVAYLQGKDTSVTTSLLPETQAPPAELFSRHHQTFHLIPMAMTQKVRARIPLGLMRRGSCENATGEGEWLASECGMGKS
jgi:hypothetical protein